MVDLVVLKYVQALIYHWDDFKIGNLEKIKPIVFFGQKNHGHVYVLIHMKKNW